MKIKTLLLCAATVASIGALGAQSRADSIDYLSGPVVHANTPSAGLYEYGVNFQITFGTPTQTVQKGDQFVMFDIPGLQTAETLNLQSSDPTDWVVSTPNTGPLSPDLNAGATDDSSKPNVSFVYNPASSSTEITGFADLGTFYFVTNVQLSDPIYAEAQYHSGDTKSFNSTVVPVPVPAAAWMGMSTLVGIGAIAALRKRRQAVA